jgi:hypothetical protein
MEDGRAKEIEVFVNACLEGVRPGVQRRMNSRASAKRQQTSSRVVRHAEVAEIKECSASQCEMRVELEKTYKQGISIENSWLLRSVFEELCVNFSSH